MSQKLSEDIEKKLNEVMDIIISEKDIIPKGSYFDKDDIGDNLKTNELPYASFTEQKANLLKGVVHTEEIPGDTSVLVLTNQMVADIASDASDAEIKNKLKLKNISFDDEDFKFICELEDLLNNWDIISQNLKLKNTTKRQVTIFKIISSWLDKNLNTLIKTKLKTILLEK